MSSPLNPENFTNAGEMKVGITKSSWLPPLPIEELDTDPAPADHVKPGQIPAAVEIARPVIPPAPPKPRGLRLPFPAEPREFPAPPPFKDNNDPWEEIGRFRLNSQIRMLLYGVPLKDRGQIVYVEDVPALHRFEWIAQHHTGSFARGYDMENALKKLMLKNKWPKAVDESPLPHEEK